MAAETNLVKGSEAGDYFVSTVDVYSIRDMPLGEKTPVLNTEGFVQIVRKLGGGGMGQVFIVRNSYE
jgi:hypothetical protein